MNQKLRTIFRAALDAADPYSAVRNALHLQGTRLSISGKVHDLAAFNRIIVVGAGKATAGMARAAEDVLGGAITNGLIIVKYGHKGVLSIIDQIEAGHPLPDQSGVDATARMIELLRTADEKTLVFFLLSGGGSSLLVSPAEGVTLEDKQAMTQLLLLAGAPIHEINAVRKHLSRIKGGRLADLASPAPVATLILSDVIGNRLDAIASGPSVCDTTTYQNALGVIDAYGLREKAPPHVINLLEAGLRGDLPETPKEGSACFRNTSAMIVAGLARSLDAAAGEAESLGYPAKVITAELDGDVRDAARFLAKLAREHAALAIDAPVCLISGGETTVKVAGNGTGGRSQELALAFAVEIEGLEGVTLLSAGTDGTDGPTDAAGAIVDGTTAARARSLGIDPVSHLDRNDSYSFFQRFDARSGEMSHIITGPTGTNVMDVQIMLIKRRARYKGKSS